MTMDIISVLGDTSATVPLALFVTVMFSAAFFYMMRWAVSSSERQQSRHRRVSVGDGFTATRHKKPAPPVVHQRKKNGKNVAVRPAVVPDNSDTVGVNGRNGDSNNKKKKTVENGSVLADDVTAIEVPISNRRSRRQKTQELLIQPADASTATVPVNNHLLSFVDDDQEDNEGEWITMVTYMIII